MRTETLAIVFTDIKGYTAATATQSHQENARMLRRIERLIAPVVRAYNGRVIKSIGDAYMIVFRSPTVAVRCAMAVQDRLYSHNRDASEGEAIHIRIAMNVGEVRVHRGDVFGEPVNVAARIEGVTPADEIYISEAVYLTMNRSDLGIEAVGDFELKGITEPVAVHRIKKFNDPDTEAAEEGAEPHHGNGALPYGGTQLGHWHRMRWIRRAYVAIWAFALAGIVLAAYLRYRPESDWIDLVADAKAAAEAGDPHGVLGAAAKIPKEAKQERADVRRFRRKAVGLLLSEKNYEAAAQELEDLLKEDQRDAEAIMFKGLLRREEGKLEDAMQLLAEALKLNASLGRRTDVIEAVVDGYQSGSTRKTAEFLVESAIQKDAVPVLAAALKNPEFGDRRGRHVMANRLEKLGSKHLVEWVDLYIADLKSTSCRVRKEAITKLLAISDERAVGHLFKLGGSKSCHAQYARNTANTILNSK